VTGLLRYLSPNVRVKCPGGGPPSKSFDKDLRRMGKALDGLEALISGHDEDCGSSAPKKLAGSRSYWKDLKQAQAEQG
jgi:hypothetical protein